MSEQDTDLLRKIRTHLYDLHSKWSQDKNSDHHCKSNEGYVGYSVAYPNWFEADEYISDEPDIYGVEIYSYLFGTGRLHEFKNLREAWETVKTWKYKSED